MIDSAPPASTDGAPEFARRHPPLAQRLVAAALGHEVHGDHQAHAQQQAGHDAADEQAPHRHVGQVAVDDQPDARRDDRRDDRRAGGDRRREAGRVAAADHLGAQHLGLHRRIGVGRRRQAAHQGGQHHVGLRDAADHVADQRVGQVQQPPRDAGAVHDGAGADEEGHGQQRKGIGGLHELLHEHAQRQAVGEDEEGQRRDGHRKGHRDVEREQHEHQQRGQVLHAQSSAPASPGTRSHAPGSPRQRRQAARP